jgi:hypothetical protein
MQINVTEEISPDEDRDMLGRMKESSWWLQRQIHTLNVTEQAVLYWLASRSELTVNIIRTSYTEMTKGTKGPSGKTLLPRIAKRAVVDRALQSLIDRELVITYEGTDQEILVLAVNVCNQAY